MSNFLDMQYWALHDGIHKQIVALKEQNIEPQSLYLGKREYCIIRDWFQRNWGLRKVTMTEDEVATMMHSYMGVPITLVDEQHYMRVE